MNKICLCAFVALAIGTIAGAAIIQNNSVSTSTGINNINYTSTVVSPSTHTPELIDEYFRIVSKANCDDLNAFIIKIIEKDLAPDFVREVGKSPGYTTTLYQEDMSELYTRCYVMRNLGSHPVTSTGDLLILLPSDLTYEFKNAISNENCDAMSNFVTKVIRKNLVYELGSFYSHHLPLVPDIMEKLVLLKDKCTLKSFYIIFDPVLFS